LHPFYLLICFINIVVDINVLKNLKFKSGANDDRPALLILFDFNNVCIAYLVKSTKSNFIYVGYTNDLRRRFKEHNEKKLSTKAYAPFKLVYFDKRKQIKASRKCYRSS